MSRARAAALAAVAALALPACTPARPVAALTTRAEYPVRRGPIIAAEAWSFEGIPGQKITTPSFRLYTTVGDSLLLDRLPLFAELALAHYQTALAQLPPPTGPLETFVVADRAQWTRVTRRLMGDDSEIYLRITRGGFAAKSRGVYYDIGPHETLAVAAHEGWHQYTQATFAQPLPVWLEEGIATWMEGFSWDQRDRRTPVFAPWANTERHSALRRAVLDGDIRPLGELLTARPQDEIRAGNERALRYYGQVWALVHFLHEADAGIYRGALRSILIDAAEGTMLRTIEDELGPRAAYLARTTRTGPQVLAAYLPDVPPETLEARYRAFIQRITRPEARALVEQGFSPAS